MDLSRPVSNERPFSERSGHEVRGEAGFRITLVWNNRRKAREMADSARIPELRKSSGLQPVADQQKGLVLQRNGSLASWGLSVANKALAL